MVTLNSGTATTRKLRGNTYPSYNELLMDDYGIFVNLINTETGYKNELAKYSVDLDGNEYCVFLPKVTLFNKQIIISYLIFHLTRIFI